MFQHERPDRSVIKANRVKEPEGERIRASLERWLKRNKIVSIYLDTETHTVEVQSAKLPPRIKNVLTIYGSVYVKDPTPEPGCENSD